MQIGPRIRVGGSLGKFGDKAKKVGQKALSNPWVQGGLGLLTGGATIPLLAGAAGGFLKEHAGVGDVVKGAGKGFLAGSAGKGVRSIGQSLLSSGGSGGATVTSAGGAVPPPAPVIPPSASAGAVLAGLESGNIVASRGALSRVADAGRSAASSVGKFVEKNPAASAMALQGVGDLASSGSESRMNDAQADILEQRADETRYDFEQRKRREAAMAPIWSSLGSTIGGNYSQVAKNPYAVG